METLTSSERAWRSSGCESVDDVENRNSFPCEMCYSGNSNLGVFKERRHLDMHMLKNHSTVCICCYGVFDSKERLLEHLEAEKHERPSYCRQCRGVFLNNADMEGHDCGYKSPAMEAHPVLKEECASSDDDEDAMVSCVNPFVCEICNSADNQSHAVFKERSDLVLHTFKIHPCTCIGCFENFHTLDDLRKHAMTGIHGLPFCHGCGRLFPDNGRLVGHPCQPTSIIEEKHEDKEMPLKIEPRSEDEESFVEMEPRSEDEEMESLYSNTDDSNDGSDLNFQKCYLHCIHCTAEGFQNQYNLRVHTSKIHSSVCVICFEGFDDEMSLQNHRKALHHNAWKCARCDMVFVKQTRYRKHVSINHPDDCPYHCPDCDMKGFKERDILCHRRKVHGDMTVNVRICPQSKSKVKLDWRLFPNMCSICLKSFMTGYSLLLHMFKDHNKPGQTHVYKCELCQLGFGRGRVFEVHLKEDHADDTEYLNDVKAFLESTLQKSLYCDICQIPWPTSNRLQRHILNKHPQLRPHKCNICGAGYPEEGDVRVHMRSDHAGPNYFVCPVCGFTGAMAISLERHLKKQHGYQGMPHVYCFAHKKGFFEYKQYRVHFEMHHMDPTNRPVRPPVPKTGFPCHICGKEFGLPIRLKSHITKVHFHSGERFKCEECGKSFKDILGLTTHKRKHTDDFKCKICNKTFELQNHLNRHQVVHSGEKPFHCELCGLKVSQRSSLQRHVKVVHADGKVSKIMTPRRTRGPKHEGGMNKKKENEEQSNGTKNDSATEDPASKEVKMTTPHTRRTNGRRVSKSSEGSLSEKTSLSKRPRVDADIDEHRMDDDSGTNVSKRGRSRKAKDIGESQRQLQILADNDVYLGGPQRIEVVSADSRLDDCQSNEAQEILGSDEEWKAPNDEDPSSDDGRSEENWR